MLQPDGPGHSHRGRAAARVTTRRRWRSRCRLACPILPTGGSAKTPVTAILWAVDFGPVFGALATRADAEGAGLAAGGQ